MKVEVLETAKIKENKNTPTIIYSVGSYETIDPEKAKFIDKYLSTSVAEVPYYLTHKDQYPGISHSNLYKYPLLFANDLLQDPYQFVSPNSPVTQMSSSGGTYGKRKLLFRTETDAAKSIDTAVSMFSLSGITKKDIVAIMQPFDLWNIGHLGMSAFKEIGALSIPLGLSIKEEDILDLLAFTKASVLYGTPSKIISLAMFGEQKQISNELNISKVLCAGEPITVEQREIIKKIWGAEIFGIYGSEETDGIGAECSSHSGYHLMDKNMIIEILNPETLVPAEKPEGVIAATKVGYNGTTLIRYLLGDKVQLDESPCECGVKSPRIKPRGRLEETIWLFAGTKVSLHSVDEMMSGVFGKLPIYQLKVEQQNNKDILVIRILGEESKGLREIFNREIRKISQDLTACLDSGRIEVQLSLCPELSIFESTVRGKLPKVIYKREGAR